MSHTHAIPLSEEVAVDLARLIETSESPAAVPLYPVASLIRSRFNLDRCDGCGRLSASRHLVSTGDLSLCGDCRDASHPYRSAAAKRIDAEAHDIPRFMAAHPIELD